ncbi:peroxiredoxin [Sphingomonas sp. BE138]|uniref:peroxiredoxin-like family protein n=1 Tax=Sphingomonas sp. BE138 TaxID=2817845 RepID=UPI0028647BA7|nr:peroxiredoxin-like family protein [Sphingomonas sp. BE138]MDR6789293.1 peroxiredoxin [Sphingomonas sp. BE138]
MTTLRARFEALEAERERDWPPERLRANRAQRQVLVDRFDPAAVVREGQRVESFVLDTPAGPVTLEELTSGGDLLLIFFRFAGCPACNVALPYYDETLAGPLAAQGVRIVAVTPHLQEEGADAIRNRHQLSYTVATDRGNALARRFGLAFLPQEPATPPVAGGEWIGSLTGTGTGELPQPALVLIGEDHVVQFVDVSPDWLRRTEASSILPRIRAAAVS